MFRNFKKAIQDRLGFLIKNSPGLFQVEVDKDELWNLYLDSFPPGTNEIFRERREHDCSCCRHFVKNYGVIIGIINGKIISLWDVTIEEPYQTVANALNEFIISKPISDVFCSKFAKLGTDYNLELMEERTHRWDHFYYELPSQFVSNSTDSIATLQSKIRQTKEVIARSFEELTPSAVDAVLELIEDKSLYRGEEHRSVLTKFKDLQQQWIISSNKDNYCWSVAVTQGRVAAIRNTAIGTLLINLSEGMDLDAAVSKYEQVVAPANYKRPKAIFTKAMVKAAEEKISELGLTDSLPRRYAVLEDISIQNVLWASGESQKVMKSVFDQLVEEVKVNPASYEHAEQMGIEYFINKVLPGVQSLEILVENAHRNNLVSLIAPVNPDAPSMLKWDNGFSWSYSGNFTDSIKESVKSRGGKVDGDLRFSLSWAEGDTTDNSDLDAHCHYPKGHIYYGDKRGGSGELDVDIQYPEGYKHKDIVENITWASRKMMRKGLYKFEVHNYALRGTQKGFTAELEFDGMIHTFHYSNPLQNKEIVHVVTLQFDGQNFEIVKSISSTQASKQVWGISTMKFIPVTTVMFSPNHWDEQGIGNRHYFFMLEGCKNEDTARGFYNEFLRNDLMRHKRVFEALGSKMKVEDSDHQLSGLGFSSTMKNSITVKVNNKPIKINFTDEQLISHRSTQKVSV